MDYLGGIPIFGNFQINLDATAHEHVPPVLPSSSGPHDHCEVASPDPKNKSGRTVVMKSDTSRLLDCCTTVVHQYHEVQSCTTVDPTSI